MSGLPDRIAVGPHIYAVEVDTRSCDDKPLGNTDNVNLVFTVSPSQALSQLRDTVLHELLHALLEMIGVGERLGMQQILHHDEEERLVRALSPLLLDALRRNPELVKFLLED